MKKFFFVLCGIVLVFAVAGNAGATSYSFEDMIDYWNFDGSVYGEDWSFSHPSDAVFISECDPLSYTHDLNDDVDFGAGDVVTSAYLEFDFTNDSSDKHGSFLIFQWDHREYASYVIDEEGVVHNLGEVDDENITGLVVDLDWLNDDGKLDVTVRVSNELGTATAWLDHSRLYGDAETASPVPEPTTMLLFGFGLLGLVGFSRKRFGKKR